MQFELNNLVAVCCLINVLNNQAIVAAILRRRQRRRARRRNGPIMWKLPRPRDSWFDIHFYDRTLDERFFRKQLRMNRTTFDALLRILQHRLSRQDTNLRSSIPPEKVLASALYRLAHGNSYESIGLVMNIGRSTVLESVEDVVEALCDLKNEYIKFPETIAETQAAIDTFTTKSNLPNIVGAIDGTHIHIKGPKDSAVDYFSRYQQYDFVIQAIADGKGLFLDFAAGYPGSMHDARVLRNSNIFDRAERGQILQGPFIRIDNFDIGPYLVGDSAYPIAPWLQKPFAESTRVADEVRFNKELSNARVVIECAFGTLKCRWRILAKRLDSNLRFSIRCATACAVLHNFCLKFGDDWDDNDNDGEDGGNNDCNDVIGDGDDLRDVLKEYLANE